MAALSVRDVGKSFGGQAVLSGVSFEVRSGTLVAILGRSGSGKTTLLRAICGFERIEAGRIAIDGRVVSGDGVHLPAERRRIGYVAQEGALFPHLRVGENIVFGLAGAARRSRAAAGGLLELVGLPARYVGRWPHELSGGEQQRVALARALAPGPTLVLLDEPFSSLDAALRAETRDAVAAALAGSGATAVLVTHDQSEAMSMGAEVAVLRQGVLVQMAPPALLYRQPVDAALARFVGEAVVLTGRASGGVASCRLGVFGVSAPVADGAVEVVIRPEQIRLGVVDAGVAAERRAVVGAVTFYGAQARVALTALNDGTAFQALVAGHLAPVPGEVVAFAVEGMAMAFARSLAPGDRSP
jgi:iron(III) transport system ATP-binding protein